MDENLKVDKYVTCPTVDSGSMSKQPAPGKPGKPQPTAKPGKTQPGTGVAGTGTVSILFDSDKTAIPTEDSFKVKYSKGGESKHSDAEIRDIDIENGTFKYIIPDYDPDAVGYTVIASLTYNLEDETQLKSARSEPTLVKGEDFGQKGAWDMNVTLDPEADPDSISIGGRITLLEIGEPNTIYFNEEGMVISMTEGGNAIGVSDVNLTRSNSTVDYKLSELSHVKAGDKLHFYFLYALNGNDSKEKIWVTNHTITEANLNDLQNINFSGSLSEQSPSGASSLLSTVTVRNGSTSAIKSVSIASCDSTNKCASNTVPVGLAAGASTKFKPTFSVPSTTRRLSCVIKFANGTSKQCTPQLVTGSNGLQFSITTQANNTVSTTVLSPLKTADTNRDCKITSADATGLRDLDGNGSVNAADTSLFFGFIGQNACN